MVDNRAQTIPFPSGQVRHIPLKRAFDILFSLSALLILSPIFLAIALVVKLSSRGPIFYSHERIGRGGHSFHLYKFRTMYPNADNRLDEILTHDKRKREEWESVGKLKEDPRITPIGRFLRKSSLDELPQFWNVLKGDLSVVGPRAVIEEELLHYYREKAYKILSIRPGITGLWQVSGRNTIDYNERISLDETYVDNYNILLDLKLIALTIPAVLLSRGAY